MDARAHSPPGSTYLPAVGPGGIEMAPQRLPLTDPGEAELQIDTPFWNTALEWQTVARYNDSTAPLPMSPSERKTLLRNSAIKLVALLLGSLAVLAFVLWLALPTIDAEHRSALRIPRNFEQLHALNSVLLEYTKDNYARVMFAWVAVYLYLQSFSIPGSMYMSILAGALWGVHVALPLACVVIAFGSTLCFLLSSCAGECIRAVPQWDARVRKWQDAIAEHSHDLLSYLILVRITPIPHFVVNLVSPHLGVPIGTFWLSALFGSIPQTVIHTAVGEKLDEIVSSKDMHIFTLHNMLLFGLVVVAATAPMILRRLFSTTAPDAPHGPIHLDENAPQRQSFVDRVLPLVYPRWRRRRASASETLDEDAPPLDESADAWRDIEWRQRPLADMPPMDEGSQSFSVGR
ncbi:hypothetical protein MCUN1_001384 [Malassezia cuniculi]|uniref:VTT domain-containing protein n=1 Tax=Malassezia cuniculi TaxID=948313 RepID=A0AAF0J5S8_9BASI|nr:hypothetical protein MCUN1_001384 [Malassezia cuniculi]